MQLFEQVQPSEILHKAAHFTVDQFLLQKQAIKFKLDSGAELIVVLFAIQSFFWKTQIQCCGSSQFISLPYLYLVAGMI